MGAAAKTDYFENENENPFFFSRSRRRIALQSRKRHQEEWYSDNHRGLPLSALSAVLRCAWPKRAPLSWGCIMG